MHSKKEAKITEMYVPGLTERVEVLERRMAELAPREAKDRAGTGKHTRNART